MNLSNQIISEKVIHALGWTVLHSVWQVSLLALIMAIILWFLKNKSAKIRYTIGCAILVLMIGISQITFLYQWLNFKTLEKVNASINIESDISFIDESFQVFLSSESNWSEKLMTYLNGHIHIIVAFWIIGFFLFAIRLFGGLNQITKIRRTALHEIDDKWKIIMASLSERLPIKRVVQLAESALIKVPMVIGYSKPLILFPIGALNQLEQKEVEAILAHELGHIFRNDYVVNIHQSIVDVCFYFHPAAWWISSQIRIEREICCDDLAIEVTKCSLTYAKAMVQIQGHSNTAPMMAMAIDKDNKQLLNRIKRILNQPTKNTYPMKKLITSFLLLFLIFGLTIYANTSYDYQLSHQEELENLIENESAITIHLDTIIPTEKKPLLNSGEQNRSDIVKKTDNQMIKFSIENDRISNLEIDGKKIDKRDYYKHQDLIDDLKKNQPLPPSPPSPPASPPSPPASPVPPNAPAPPTAPSPPTAPVAPVAPPAAPVAPIPPAPPTKKGGMSSEPKVTLNRSEKDEKIIIENDTRDLEESLNISVISNQKVVDGERVEITEKVDFEKTMAEIEEEINRIGDYKGNNQNSINSDSTRDSSFDFQAYINGNKYPESLSKIHRNYGLEIYEINKEGSFTKEIEKLSRTYSKDLEKELEALKRKARKHIETQRTSIEKLREQRKLAHVQQSYNEQLYQLKLTNELLDDGLIDSVRNFNFQLKDNHMKVNENKYSGTRHAKYLKMYEETMGIKADKKLSYQLRNNGAN